MTAPDLIRSLIARLQAGETGRELNKAVARAFGFRIAAAISSKGPEVHIMRQNDDVASWDLPDYAAAPKTTISRLQSMLAELER